jgi:putative hydrolase of the HAD superfamily
MPRSATQLVLFDLGGVLFELGGVPDFGAMIGETRAEEIWRAWNACECVRAYETGRCDRDAFARGLVETFRLTLEPAAFLDRFTRWMVGPFPGAEDLVLRTARAARVGCLSNNNDLHWPLQRDLPLARAFEFTLLSHELGHVKPDRACFERVIERVGVGPEAILFLDDSAINVAAARECGIDAELAVGVEGAARVLAERGIVAR